MSTEQVKRALALARRKVCLLYVTGGEPLVRSDLVEILRWAKEQARFHHVGLVTNGLLLPRREALLPFVDDLAISLHTLDERHGDATMGVGGGALAEVLRAVERYGDARRRWRYRFNVSCVVMPDRIADARDVMRFCFARHIPYAVMPQSITPYPHPALVGNLEYLAFIDEVIACKRRGEPVWGSYAYLRTIRDFRKFRCYPTTALRIFPSGELVYPCSPLDKMAGNLLDATTFDEVLAEGVARHGPVPECDTRCFASCYIETSFIIEHPLAIAWEHLDLWARARRRLSPTRATRGATAR